MLEYVLNSPKHRMLKGYRDNTGLWGRTWFSLGISINSYRDKNDVIKNAKYLSEESGMDPVCFQDDNGTFHGANSFTQNITVF